MPLMDSRRFGKGYPDSPTQGLMKNMNITRDRLNEPLTLKGQTECSLHR